MFSWYIVGTLVLSFAVATYLMRGYWNSNAVFVYALCAFAAVYGIFLVAFDHDPVTGRSTFDLDELLPYLGAVVSGALAGTLADSVMRMLDWHRERDRDEKFRKEHPLTTRYRTDHLI